MDTNTCNVCLVVLCGIPACGKSTLAQILKEYIDRYPLIKGDLQDESDNVHKTLWTRIKACQKDELSRTQCVVISYDQFITEDMESELIEQEENSLWKAYRSELLQCVDNLIDMVRRLHSTTGIRTISTASEEQSYIDPCTPKFEKDVEELRQKFEECIMYPIKMQITSGLWKSNLAIVIDDNMYYSSMRYKFYQLARKYTCSFCQLHLDIDVSTALKRNKERTSGIVPNDVIMSMVNKLEAPDSIKNSWEKRSLTLKSEDLNFSLEQEKLFVEVIRLLCDAMEDPVQPLPDEESKEESRRICSENVIHQADQVLRKLIGQTMAQAKGKNNSKNEMQSLLHQVSKAKSDILESLKSGTLYLIVEDENHAVQHDKLTERVTKLFHQKKS